MIPAHLTEHLWYVYSVWRHSTMYITIDEADRRPLIARGELEEGVALPPVRQVATDLGVNLNTIAAAYRELQKEGLLKVRHGAGAFVSSRRSAQQTDAELRKRLRAGLTHLALAGLPKSEVVEIVNEEIRQLYKLSR